MNKKLPKEEWDKMDGQERHYWREMSEPQPDQVFAIVCLLGIALGVVGFLIEVIFKVKILP